MVVLAVTDGADDESYDVYDAYVARFGAPVIGANIHIGIRVINSNGQASPLEVIKATVSA